MPRKGRRSEAAKKRWRTLDQEDLQSSQPDIAKPRTSPPTARAWTPIQSPEKKMSRLLEPPDQVVGQEEPRRPLTFLVPWDGRRHRVLKWPVSPVTFRSHKLVLPAEVPEKRVCCFYVRYLSVVEHFPRSSLDLWSRDGVHLSDRPGMEVLAQLLWAASYTQLELSAPTSPAPPPAPATPRPPVVRRSPPRLIVVGEVPAPRPSDPFAWTVVRGGQKGDLLDSTIPPNPVWFSPTVLEEMDRIVPASGSDAPLPTRAPKGKKVEGAPTERTRPARRQPRRAAPTLEVDAPAESSPMALEDHVRDDSCQVTFMNILLL
ncbi:hypothetical protein GOODEAATRI_032620 [Goodea atripinnis]|uniref:Uncharacterized protein n=1 Tax=Goodea atripinnis TaxID=208336 RepID=A0ABV0N639_9TELE